MISKMSNDQPPPSGALSSAMGAAIRAGLNSAPFTGGLASLWSEWDTSRRFQRIDEAVRQLVEALDKVKERLGNYLSEIKYDEPTENKTGALVITGTGKGKKAGVDVVFAAGVFDAGKGQLAGAAFVVDSKIEDHYKDTVHSICETIRNSDALAK